MDNNLDEMSDMMAYGPALPPKLSAPTPKCYTVISKQPIESDSDLSSDEMIGPSLDTEPKSSSHYELEKRAVELKLSKLEKDNATENNEPTREEWMIELPEVKSIAGMGLRARQFRTKERADFSDQSCWTDIPGAEGKSKKSSKISEKVSSEEINARLANVRDKEQEEIAKKLKKKHKREKSLLEIHEKKLKKDKKKKKKNKEKEERRPFCRDTDLSVNNMDKLKKKKMIASASALDSRFSKGASKYL